MANPEIKTNPTINISNPREKRLARPDINVNRTDIGAGVVTNTAGEQGMMANRSLVENPIAPKRAEIGKSSNIPAVQERAPRPVSK